MKLLNDAELENTRRKLSKLEHLIDKKVQSKHRSAAYEISMESMKATAEKLRDEITEYEASDQTI